MSDRPTTQPGTREREDLAAPIEILLVEDDINDVELTLLALGEERRSQVHVVRDGAEALDFMFGDGRHAARRASTPG